MVLLSLIFIFLGTFFFGGRNNGQLYAIYDRIQKSRAWMPRPSVFGLVWSILYVLLIVAIFLVYVHDDTCRCRDLKFDITGAHQIVSPYDSDYVYYQNHEAAHGDDGDSDGDGDGLYEQQQSQEICLPSKLDRNLQTVTWCLILINIILNRLWDVIVREASPLRASLAFGQTLATFLTAIAITILLFIFASKTDDIVYISAIIYTLYSIWLAIATVLAYSMLANFRLNAVLSKPLKTYVVKIP